MAADHQLHGVFFPLMAHGHMIPMLDTAQVFASRGVKATIITTPHNAPFFTKTQNTNVHMISIHVIKFPGVEAGLPLGCENLDQLTSLEMLPGFGKATEMLQEPLEHLLREFHPDFLVADMFFPWATDVAAKFDIPRLVFHGTSLFALCASQSVTLNKPFKNVTSESQHFVIPDLPHEIKLTRAQVDPNVLQSETGTVTLFKQIDDSELRSHGSIINSFYELEPEYAHHFGNVLKKKAWLIGPVSLCNRIVEDKAQRGKAITAVLHENENCLKWLDSKKPKSVVYVCFGSVTSFSASQLIEIAMAIEASENDFIWVVRQLVKNHVEDDHDRKKTWLPEGFEGRIKGKCLIIRGWAPQVLILDHQAIGGFVTHCGWNSILEGICGGVPMVTWPVFAEQFYNEKLVTEILRVGVAIGGQEMNILGTNERVIRREDITKTVRRIMAGEEAEEMRKRAKVLKEMGSKAMEEGTGSSSSDLNALIQDLVLMSSY